MKRTFLSLALMCMALLTAQNMLGQTMYDWTAKITNPSFENGAAGWTVQKSVSGWEDLKIVSGSAADGSQHYNLWAQNINSIGLSQAITLPAGTYTLSAQLRTNPQGVSDQNVYAKTSAGTSKSAALTVADTWTKLSVDFTLSREETVTIGATGTGNGQNEKGWFCVDDFRLMSNQEPGADMDRTVAQVTDAITLSGTGALYITGSKPFAVTGKVDITNTEHAVIFVDSLRPSQFKSWLGYITINGEAAVSEKNCQLRLYDHGTLLYPYGKENKSETGFHPLTVYTGKNCTGESCDRFGIENTNGFMNSLTEETLNNRIRSFRLKRGYMVTFSIQTEGWGYQRCFIADKEDLVVNELSAILDQRISSYRIFRWDNVGKNGVANILNTTNLGKLNCTWTYAWGVGNSLGTDYECVPHMNNLWSASTYDLGVNNQSPYLKTDNEPANGNDPKPASVAEELERWPELMRTGRRLLSPSSFDSGEWWHKQFFDSIDARGWRCDIVDIHSYWGEGSFNNIKSNWADKFQRPVWITEFIWGASWSGGFGIFGIARTDEEKGNPSEDILNQNRDVLARIWAKLNSYDYVERYAYWNDEWPCSKILWNNNLTPAGEYYSKMKTGPSFSGTYQFVPRDWRLQAVTDLAATYVQRTGLCTVTWTNYNGDLNETATLQRRRGTGAWETVAVFTRPDDHTLTFTETVTEAGFYTYRVIEKTYKNTTLTSNTATFSIAKGLGTEELQYGRIENDNADALTVSLEKQDIRPRVFLGMISNVNSNVGIVPRVMTIVSNSFSSSFEPWSLPETTADTKAETVDFIAIKAGQYQWGNMRAEVDTCRFINGSGSQSMTSKGEVIDVAFQQPFEEGVTPVVILQPVTSNKTAATPIAKLIEVTNKGFRMKLVKQEGNTKSIMSQYTYYIAITPGQANLDEEGKSIVVGRCEATPVGGTTAVACNFKDDKGETIRLRNPYIIAAPQTHRLDYTSLFRQASTITGSATDDSGTYTATTGIRVRRQMDTSLSASEIGTNTAAANGDIIGWIAINDGTVDDPTGIEQLPAAQSVNRECYDLSGRRVTTPRKGLYIIGNKKVLMK